MPSLKQLDQLLILQEADTRLKNCERLQSVRPFVSQDAIAAVNDLMKLYFFASLSSINTLLHGSKTEKRLAGAQYDDARNLFKLLRLKDIRNMFGDHKDDDRPERDIYTGNYENQMVNTISKKFIADLRQVIDEITKRSGVHYSLVEITEYNIEDFLDFKKGQL